MSISVHFCVIMYAPSDRTTVVLTATLGVSCDSHGSEVHTCHRGQTYWSLDKISTGGVGLDKIEKLSSDVDKIEKLSSGVDKIKKLSSGVDKIGNVSSMCNQQVMCRTRGPLTVVP